MYIWDFSFAIGYLPALLRGALNTILISFLAILIGTSLAIGLVVLQRSDRALLEISARVYIELLIALPVFVLLVWVFYCLPIVGIQLSAFAAAVVVLGMSLSAFLAELIRGAIGAIPVGQIEAGKIAGLSTSQVDRYIVLPQVLRVIGPAFLNEYITTLKFSTIASVIGAPELLYQTAAIIAQTYRPLEMYTILACIFLALVLPLTRMSRTIERRRQWRL